MTSHRPYARYLALAGGLAFAACLATLLFNAAVDPYGMLGTPRVTGFNARKIYADRELQAYKVKGLQQIRPRTVILGNSRAEVGLDPSSPAWPQQLRPVFNAAVPGTGLRTAARMLYTAHSAGNLDAVVLAVDFPDFLARQEAPMEPLVEMDVDARVVVTPREQLVALATLDTLVASVSTVLQQSNRFAPEITSLGFNPMRDYELAARREGYARLFRQKNIDYARRYANGPKSLAADARGFSPEFEQLRVILRFAREHALSVKLLVYPYHMDLLEILRLSSLETAYGSWKGQLAQVVAEERAAGTKVELWDFSGPSEPIRERVPGNSDRGTGMRWFWESGHFKSQLGESLIAEITGGTEVLGRRLGPENVDRQLRDLAQMVDDFEREDPGRAAMLAELVGKSASAATGR